MLNTVINIPNLTFRCVQTITHLFVPIFFNMFLLLKRSTAQFCLYCDTWRGRKGFFLYVIAYRFINQWFSKTCDTIASSKKSIHFPIDNNCNRKPKQKTYDPFCKWTHFRYDTRSRIWEYTRSRIPLHSDFLKKKTFGRELFRWYTNTCKCM